MNCCWAPGVLQLWDVLQPHCLPTNVSCWGGSDHQLPGFWGQQTPQPHPPFPWVIWPQSGGDGARWGRGEVRTGRRMELGEVARSRIPLPETTSCSDISAWFGFSVSFSFSVSFFCSKDTRNTYPGGVLRTGFILVFSLPQGQEKSILVQDRGRGTGFVPRAGTLLRVPHSSGSLSPPRDLSEPGSLLPPTSSGALWVLVLGSSAVGTRRGSNPFPTFPAPCI